MGSFISPGPLQDHDTGTLGEMTGSVLSPFYLAEKQVHFPYVNPFQTRIHFSIAFDTLMLQKHR